MTDEHKIALVTGITGQDGSYLTELLLEKGYTVSIRTVTIPPIFHYRWYVICESFV
jgi:nucleoside-diphosphate-sugar epimerase